MDQVLFLGGPRDKDVLSVTDTQHDYQLDGMSGAYTPYEIQLFDDSKHAPVTITVMLLKGTDPCMFYDTVRRLRLDDRYANLFMPYRGPSKRPLFHG